MSRQRHFNRPTTIQEVQEKLEEACVLYEEADIEVHKLEELLKDFTKKRERAWFTFNQLQATRRKLAG